MYGISKILISSIIFFSLFSGKPHHREEPNPLYKDLTQEEILEIRDARHLAFDQLAEDEKAFLKRIKFDSNLLLDDTEREKFNLIVKEINEKTLENIQSEELKEKIKNFKP